MTAKIDAASAPTALDEWVREIIEWHFNPDTGCPFWLDWARDAGWDPRQEVRSFDDLTKFPHFEDEKLRGGPVRRWVPKAYAERPTFVFETGGTTGIPKSRVAQNDFRIDYELFSDTLPDEHFPRGSNWLMLGPSGPRRLRLAVEHLAQFRGGICFCLDLDPRWVVKLLKQGKTEDAKAYAAHVIDQAMTILEAGHDIQCAFSTPKLLEALALRLIENGSSIAEVGIKGIFCGGTEMNAQFHRFAREELVPGIDFVPTYGNTLMGLACCKPFDPADDYAIIYFAPQPRAVIELVDPDDPSRVVDYGETGRVMLSTLTKEFFMPRFLERDEAERAEPIDRYPWDGVANLRLLTQMNETVTVGVY